MRVLERIEYHDGETPLTGWLARPVGLVRAAVAVFPTIWNTTPAVEAKARALADAGYLALIADYYGTTPEGREEIFARADDLRADVSQYRRRLHAALNALRDHAGDMPMAAIGFCMGGQAALELARDGVPLVVVASFHGLLDTLSPALPGKITSRILVCHGDADPLVPRQQVMAFWEEMDQAGANWHFHSYSGVQHGFTNFDAPPGGTGVAYDASADRQSWTALLALLDEELAE